jgi:hypothetical protein
MTIDDNSAETDDYAEFSSTSLAGLHRRLKSGHVPTRAELAAVLAANAAERLPVWFVDCLCRSLCGGLRRKPGPKPRWPLQDINEILAAERYRRLLVWLKKRKRSQGLEGWSCIRGKDWWQGPPHQRALLMVHARMKRFRHISPQRLANIISSRK